MSAIARSTALPALASTCRAGTPQVRRALEETGAGLRCREPKGKRRRTLALAPIVLEALRAHKQEQDQRHGALGPDYKDGDLVCGRGDGSVRFPSALPSAYRGLLRRWNLMSPNFHALGHGHASQLLKAGETRKVAYV